MKNLPSLLVLLCVATIASAGLGCRSYYRDPAVGTHIDPISGVRTDVMADNELPAGDQPDHLLWLNAYRIYKSMGDYQFYLEAQYAARPEKGYLDIAPGDSLIIRADGQELRLKTSGSMNTRKGKEGILRETALYPVDSATLKTIANAQEVQVSVVGKNGRVERTFAPENQARFVAFVQKFVRR